MMKRVFLLISMFFLLFGSSLRADEGMWLLSLINKNYDDMKKQGFKLTPEDIYSVNKACLKDAICGLGNSNYPMGFFCTGEIISSKGLILTNHHCGYEAIQSHSTVEHDYLSDGFWAMSFDKELPNEGMCVSILLRIEDVTDSVLAKVTPDMNDEKRESVINKAIKEIEKRNRKPNVNVAVKPMFEGNQFVLFVYETYSDVRLVGAPPSAIGKFGGDTDNWMWPRHTGDFCLLRVYSAPDGSPAAYSKDNVPLKPRHHLPVSIKGVEKGDFTMVMGFPGSTDRYLTSFGVINQMEVLNPAAIKIRTKKLELMKEDMNSSDKIRIQYASKYAQTANYWKYFIGQNKGLKRLNVVGQKQKLEEQFTAWVNQDEARKTEYGGVLQIIEKSFADNKQKALAYQYVIEGLFQGGEIVMFPLQLIGLQRALGGTDAEAIKSAVEEAREGGKAFFKDFNPSTDKKILAALLKMYYEDMPAEYHLEIFAVIQKKYKGDFDAWANDVYKKSFICDEARFNAFLDKPTLKALEADPAFVLSQQALGNYFKLQNVESEDMPKAKRLLVKGLMFMQTDKNFYPDANSTIRITYGTVGDYRPADAVYYSYYTTLEGIMDKEDPKNDEFIVPAKLKELYQKKDFGRYADKDGQMRVCFTSNNDITGGNSGSPVINGNGELVGVAFDGNWEAMSGDIAFEPNLQKCINVDSRYVLFVIDKLAGAKNLIDEMTIVQ